MLIKRRNFYILGLIIAFNLLLVNYLFSFNEGATNSGTIIRLLLKVISIVLICSCLKPSNFDYFNLPLLLIFGFIGIAIILRIPFLNSEDSQFLNVFISLPLLFGLGPSNNRDFQGFDRFLLIIFGIWIIIDSYFYLSANSLWHNSAFIGGIGNPSSYGFVLIYIFEVASQGLKKKSIRFFIKIIAAAVLLLTQALMPILVLIFIQIFKLNKIIIFSILIIFIYVSSQIDFILELLPNVHWNYKLEALIEFIKTLDYSNTSLSISTRIEFFEGVKLLNKDVMTFLTGGVNNTYYNFGDSQMITYVTSFGVPLFLIFVFYLGRLYIKAKNTSLKYFIISFLLILITNRILDYWPIAIIIFISINRINYEHRNNKQFFSQTS